MGRLVFTSKCFENRKSEATEVNEPANVTESVEPVRQYGENWDSEFTTPERYANYKIKVLQKDMQIDLSWEERIHLRELKTRTAIDAAARSIINRHWP